MPDRPALALVASVSVCIACSHHVPLERAAEAHEASVNTAAADVVDAGEDGAPEDGGAALAGFPEIFELVDGETKLGVVGVPLGAREPRPVLVALHGGSEKPRHACPAWRGITDAYAFVVCPRGWGGNEARLGWRTVADTNDRIARAVAATKKTFGPWVKDTRTVVLAGFSMGGAQVARVARADPSTYRRIVVGDSAHDPQPALTFAHAWAAGGGERALFLCTTSGCEPSMRAAGKKVAAEKAGARLNVAPTRVHGLSERAVESTRRDWPWLVEGAEGWESYVAPANAASLGGRTEVLGPPRATP